jgi:hypothetical protein
LIKKYAHINLPILQMDAPRLDRLNALLEGLSPKVTQTSMAEGFSLHIIKAETSELSSDTFSTIQLDTLSLLVCPAEHSLQNILKQMSGV